MAACRFLMNFPQPNSQSLLWNYIIMRRVYGFRVLLERHLSGSVENISTVHCSHQKLHACSFDVGIPTNSCSSVVGIHQLLNARNSCCFQNIEIILCVIINNAFTGQMVYIVYKAESNQCISVMHLVLAVYIMNTPAPTHTCIHTHTHTYTHTHTHVYTHTHTHTHTHFSEVLQLLQ